ncbi:MAG: hypothetical protein Mars2KO_13620 [Maribacter sp.]
MGKKNLDKIFQEKFSDFSDVPDEKVWHAIKASLDKKKKSKRVIPLWWKLGGVAAVLALVIYVINPSTSENVTVPAVTNKEIPDTKTNTTIDKNGVEESLKASDTEVTDINMQESLKKEGDSSSESTSGLEKDTDANDAESGTLKFTAPSKSTQLANGKTTETQQDSYRDVKNPAMESEAIVSKTEQVAAADSNSATGNLQTSTGLPTEEDSDKGLIGKNLEQQKGTAVAQVDTQEDSSDTSEDETTKKSIFDEIAKQEEEKEAIAENKGGKWSAGPSVAPVYFDAMGEGSPVHSIFVPNSKSGDLNLSYGLSVAYEISDKLKIRSGVHRVDFGYSTDDVEFSSSLESSAIGQITNVNYSATAKNIVVASSAPEASLNTMDNLVSVAQDFSGQGLSQNGAMTQQFGYLEVPVELEYALLDKRFGVNLIGGVSSLFLVDNSISLSAGELTTQMGEANNVNSVNFSTNVGIGVNYKFSPKVQLNVEPVFKYQLNTFSRTEGTFQPFTVGVYSGVSFRF